MGNVLKSRIRPFSSESHSQQNSLLRQHGQVSRSNFKFIERIDNFGLQQQSILWRACNIKNESEQYLIRQTSKQKLYNNKRIAPTMSQLLLLTQTNNKFLLKTYFAFQDYEYLYLVCEYISAYPLMEVMKVHEFSENQTKYIASALISVIEEIHGQGYAITQLSPRQIYIDKVNGSLKIVRIAHPVLIDSYCSLNAVQQICSFSAPQILYRDKVLAQCDYYSLGLIVYQLMTQSHIAQSLEDDLQKKVTRSDILRQNIEVEKSTIPQNWQPSVSDFLIKLLIKNPSIRLGRYGAFEVKNHQWLKDYYLDQSPSIKRIQQISISKSCANKEDLYKFDQLDKEFLRSYFFQQLFESYAFQREIQQQDIIIEQHQNQLNIVEQISSISNESNIRLKKNSL